MREIKETIRNPDDVDCGKKPNSMLLVRYSPKLGTKWQWCLKKWEMGGIG